MKKLAIILLLLMAIVPRATWDFWTTQQQAKMLIFVSQEGFEKEVMCGKAVLLLRKTPKNVYIKFKCLMQKCGGDNGLLNYSKLQHL